MTWFIESAALLASLAAFAAWTVLGDGLIQGTLQ